jgi:nucleoside-diphosphate-sugar epimerase
MDQSLHNHIRQLSKGEHRKRYERPIETCAVTAGPGFSGSAVVNRLRTHGYQNVFVPRSKEYDLPDGKGVRLTAN